MKNLISILVFSILGGSFTYFLIHNSSENINPIESLYERNKKVEKTEKPEFSLTNNIKNNIYELDFTKAAQKTVNAVVHIKSEYEQAYNSDPLLDYFWGPQGSRG